MYDPQFDSAALSEQTFKFTITEESEGCQWRGEGTDEDDYTFTVGPFESHSWKMLKHGGYKLVFEYECLEETPMDLEEQARYKHKNLPDLRELIHHSRKEVSSIPYNVLVPDELKKVLKRKGIEVFIDPDFPPN